jgi:hypothetical protein
VASLLLAQSLASSNEVIVSKEDQLKIISIVSNLEAMTNYQAQEIVQLNIIISNQEKKHDAEMKIQNIKRWRERGIFAFIGAIGVTVLKIVYEVWKK